jgi:hypothetical protein
MNEENENQDQSLVLVDDNIIAVAENAERRFEAMVKIRQFALRTTNGGDWVDMGGKPYLQARGAKKIARAFGVSWRLGLPEKEWREDDNGRYYIYTIKGEFGASGQYIEAIGTKSSRNPFFGKGKNVEDVDEQNIIKAAETNCVNNGIKDLLGLDGVSWEDINSAGIKSNSKVNYKNSKPQAEGEKRSEDELRKELGDIILQIYPAREDADARRHYLYEMTTFIGKDNKEVPGVDIPSRLSGRRLEVTLGKVREDFKKRDAQYG